MDHQGNHQRAQARREGGFHASVWEDYFIKLWAEPDEEIIINVLREEVETKAEEVRGMFIDAVDNHEHQLHLIDITQKLGIAFYFEKEIEEALKEIHNSYDDYNNYDDQDLHIIALRFRLLRQDCHYVSSEIFEKFTDIKGNFKEIISSDAKGLLSLYEASHLSVHGEDILDKALEFTRSHLKSIVTKLNSPLSEVVNHALSFPLRRTVAKYEEWFYISIYEKEESCNATLLKLAKLNFNFVQKLYQKELSNVSKWAKGMKLKEELPFARDRLIECYFWGLGAFPEPKFNFSRIFVAKATILVTYIDDVYDSYGTIEELELFTPFIERWAVGNIQDLPDYMKILFNVMDEFVKEIEEHAAKEGRTYCSNYVKEAMKKLCKAYITEARWFNKSIVPKLENYKSNALHGTGLPFLTTSGFSGLGHTASVEIFHWLFEHPKCLIGISDYGRVINDIGGHEFEQKRGHVASAVEIYMNQYGASKEEAYTQLRKILDNDWKDINEEMLQQVSIPKRIRTYFLNIFRISYVVYKDTDTFTAPTTYQNEVLASVIVNPFVI